MAVMYATDPAHDEVATVTLTLAKQDTHGPHTDTKTHLLHNSSTHANVCVHTESDTHNVGPKACCLLGPLPK